jgi:succinate dehydrogenase / fumarate reductase iron-sulfur subunit
VNRKIPPFTPREGVEWKMFQGDLDRVQEFRKCIECFLCQNVCHVLRDHEQKERFGGPRFFVRVAGLEMHPLDGVSRTELLKDALGIGYCNITKCCTEVCPEDIHITDNAIIPLKERVATEFYDPLAWVKRRIMGQREPRIGVGEPEPPSADA